MKNTQAVGATLEGRNCNKFEVVKGECTSYYDEKYQIKDFKHKFTCNICGDRMLSNREGATTCKRCIAEQAKEEQFKPEVSVWKSK